MYIYEINNLCVNRNIITIDINIQLNIVFRGNNNSAVPQFRNSTNSFIKTHKHGLMINHKQLVTTVLQFRDSAVSQFYKLLNDI